jgi:hypothetical protein
MSLSYDFQKWMIISLASIAISLTIGLVTLAYGQVNQTRTFNDCYNDYNDRFNNTTFKSKITKGFLAKYNVTLIKKLCNYYHNKTRIWINVNKDKDIIEQYNHGL